MPKRPIGSSQGGKGPMKKMKRYAQKRMNYVPLRWISKQNRPFRATIPINPFPPVYRTKVTWAPPATTWTPGSGNAVIQFKLNSVFDCELSSVFSATQQPLFFDTICTSTGPYKQFKVLGWRGKIHMVNLGGQSDDTPSTSLRTSMRYCISKDMSSPRKVIPTRNFKQHPIYNAIYFQAL